MSEAHRVYRVAQPTAVEINRTLGLIADRLDKLEGFRGTPEFRAAIDMTGNRVTSAGEAEADTDTPTKAQVDALIAQVNSLIVQVQALNDLAYAPTSKGVTNGDTHDHNGGDGGQVDHGSTGGLGDDDHTQYHNDARGDARYFQPGTDLLAANISTDGGTSVWDLGAAGSGVGLVLVTTDYLNITINATPYKIALVI